MVQKLKQYCWIIWWSCISKGQLPMGLPHLVLYDLYSRHTDVCLFLWLFIWVNIPRKWNDIIHVYKFSKFWELLSKNGLLKKKKWKHTWTSCCYASQETYINWYFFQLVCCNLLKIFKIKLLCLAGLLS